jgi:hypothetical protein
MNIYTGLLFLQGHIADARVFAGDAGYSRSYGNDVANQRALRPSWEKAKDGGREDDIDDVPRAA